MKSYHLLILTTLILLLAACGPKEDPIVEVSSVSMSQSTLSIARGGSANLTATVNPSTATDKTVTWSSSNSSVATVNNGTVSAVAVGTATITATASGKTATCEVTVTPKGVSSIKLDKTSVSMTVKEVLTLTATVEPADADDKTVTWTSSDESVAKVDNGKITAVGKGTAKITASAGTINVTCQVAVSYAVNSVTLDKSTAQIEEDGTLTLKATVDTDDPDVKVGWSSDATDIATVNNNGTITGIAIGEATITAKVGDKTATCKVTVKEGSYKAKERAALIKFFNANNGNNWSDYHKENWCSDEPLYLWTGVEMTPDGKHVNSLWISDENLRGQIPKEIADLTELEVFHLWNDGDYTQTYPMPKEIGQLKKLKDIYLWRYPISGKLPESLFAIEGLERLGISHAPLDKWTIPAYITKLKNIKELRFFDCNVTGKIPDALGQLTGLEDLYLSSNDLSGSLPASLGSLINLKKINLTNNKLSGAIPTTVSHMDNYWKLWPLIFYGNNFTMENLRDSKIPAPRSPKIKLLSGKELDIDEFFSQNQYTVLFHMNPKSGDALECLIQLEALYKVNKSKGLGILSFINNGGTSSADMNDWDAAFKDALNKAGATWDSFSRYMYEDLPPKETPFYAETGNGLYPHDTENSIVIIGPDQTVVYSTLLDNFRVTYGDAIAYLQKAFKTTITHYESKSYSLDGKVTKYQTASTGKGIDIVITGDAFSDREMASGGTFEKAAKQAAADLFSVEPYKSMKSRFNIYFVKAVSKHEEYFNGCSTVYGGVFGYGSAVGGDDDKVLEYAKKAVTDNSRMDNVAVLVLMNSVRKGGTTYMMRPADKSIYGGGASVIWVPYKDVTVSGGVSELASTIVHELGGHGVAKLADEYAYRDQGAISAEYANYTKEEQNNYEWYLNVDFTSDPKKVRWSQFIGDSAFASENIGVYQGGYTYWSGVWRPTEQSVMNNNFNHFTFNAPCRSLIWTRVMKLSEGEGWKYDYSAFKTWDKAHPTKVATRSIVETDDEAPVHVPPVIVGKTWKEVIEGR